MFKTLRLQNFRNYSDAEFTFGEGVNVVVGPNGSGKTNLLEALYFVTHGKSFRTDISALIANRADWARLDALHGGQELILKLTSGENGVRKQLQKDSKVVHESGVRVVLFEPDQLRMVHGPPELRRAWLDNLLIQLEPAYALGLKNYQRTLHQRNVLLRSGREDDLFVWEIKMSEYGAFIAGIRTQLVANFAERVNELYGAFSGSKDKVAIKYDTPFTESYGSQFLKVLGENRDHDRHRGYTTLGPHRDDLRIEFNKLPIGDIASRGERRTLYLALKFLEAALIESKFEQKAVMLLDDLFGELDDRRKRLLQKTLSDNQIIITSTDDHPIAGSLPATKRVLRL